jgi:hypothetical protein
MSPNLFWSSHPVMKDRPRADLDTRIAEHLSMIQCALTDCALKEADEVYRRFKLMTEDAPAANYELSREWMRISDR